MPKYVVRHGVMRNLGVFYTRGSDTVLRGEQVIARTNRGLAAGEILCGRHAFQIRQAGCGRGLCGTP